MDLFSVFCHAIPNVILRAWVWPEESLCVLRYAKPDPERDSSLRSES